MLTQRRSSSVNDDKKLMAGLLLACALAGCGTTSGTVIGAAAGAGVGSAATDGGFGGTGGVIGHEVGKKNEQR